MKLGGVALGLPLASAAGSFARLGWEVPALGTMLLAVVWLLVVYRSAKRDERPADSDGTAAPRG